MSPASGRMYWWRWKKDAPCPWMLGYCTHVGSGLVRMGAYNGDTNYGHVVSVSEIEWKEYTA